MADTGAGPSQIRRILNEEQHKAKRESENDMRNPGYTQSGFQEMETITGL